MGGTWSPLTAALGRDEEDCPPILVGKYGLISGRGEDEDAVALFTEPGIGTAGLVIAPMVAPSGESVLPIPLTPRRSPIMSFGDSTADPLGLVTPASVASPNCSAAVPLVLVNPNLFKSGNSSDFRLRGECAPGRMEDGEVKGGEAMPLPDGEADGPAVCACCR